MSQMFVADFFSGLDGWGAAFRDRGHRVVSFDLDPRFKPNVVVDMNNVKAVNGFDVILASPPCETFSVMTIGKYWTGGKGAYEPKNDRARHGLAIMHKTFDLIDQAQPRFYVIENPRGVMRKVAPRSPTATTWYCRWGKTYAKPTDLWTNIQGEFPACRNNQADHSRAPRGSRTGVQGEGETTWAAEARDRRCRLLAGEDVPGYKIVTSSADDSRKGLRIVVRTGSKTKNIDGGFSTFLRDKSTDEMRTEIEERTGKRLGTGGLGINHDLTRSAFRALIPYRLSLAVCLAAERDGTLPLMEEVIAVEAQLRGAA